MIIKTMDIFVASTVAVLILTIQCCHCNIREIYNTKNLTSDLGWTVYGNWEEVSTRTDTNEIIRTYQVCPSTGETDDSSEIGDNWLRTPYFETNGAERVHVEVTYYMTKCKGNGLPSCKETFNIFYYESRSDVASSTFPPWKETPYKKIDTVASSSTDERATNNKTFTMKDLSRGGFYIALQDQGACIQLLTLRLYYYYCPKIVASLATFQRTLSGSSVTALVEVNGQCVPNAVNSGKAPSNHCGGKGTWKILTEGCHCAPGYQPGHQRKSCEPCKSGYYKDRVGNTVCTACPLNSGATSTGQTGLSICPCHRGYSRSSKESASDICTHSTSAPVQCKVGSVNSTSASVTWEKPLDMGGRSDVHYRFGCLMCEAEVSCSECRQSHLMVKEHPTASVPITSSLLTTSTNAIAVDLEPFTSYKIEIFAMNEVTNSASDAASCEVSFNTNEAAPSQVVNIYVSERASTWVHIKWQPPTKPNGVITKYEVEVQPKKHDKDAKNLAEKRESKTSDIKLTGLSPVTGYNVRIRAFTSTAPSDYSESYTLNTLADNNPPAAQDPQTSSPKIAIIIGVLVVIVLLVIVLYCCCKKRCRLRFAPNQSKNFSMSTRPLLNEQSIYVEYSEPKEAVENMKIEIDKKMIKIRDMIGEGEFAVVHRASLTWNGRTEDVAVKQLKHAAAAADQKNFLREACTMAQFNHENILKLKGVVIKSLPLMIVSEFMSNGSLDKYVQVHKSTLTISDLVNKLRGVACGMKYLASMKFIHRDLAARNILVDNDGVCKVSDFGLSRTLSNIDAYATYTTQGGKIAIRWAAPESIRLRTFTSASDVWSYGILMWEVLSYGEKPYWDMENPEVIRSIENGMRLPSPTKCPKCFHTMMLECWSVDDKRRPTFDKIIADLNRNLSEIKTSTTRPSTMESELTQGRIASVEDWLNFQKLGNFKERFKKHGIDSLDKISNLTIKDLRELGIDVTLNIHKFEHDIRSLKRHLSTSSSRPVSESYSIEGEPFDDDDVMLPNGHSQSNGHMHMVPHSNGTTRSVRQYPPIPEGSVAV